VYVPPLVSPSTLADPSTPLWLTEGEKKALKACQEGLACIALPGVWSWRTRAGRVDGKSGPVEDLDHIAWQRRTVYVVFDSDLATNPSVRDAEHALAQELRRRGARPVAIRLPGGPAAEKVGLDDYLCTHSVEALCAIEPAEIRNPDVRAGAVVLEYHELLQRQYAEPSAIIGGGVLPRRGFAVVGGSMTQRTRRVFAIVTFAPASSAAATSTVRVRDRVDASPRPRRSSVAEASALLKSWSTMPAQAITSNGGPSSSRNGTGLALPTATKNQVGRSGGRRGAA
jgi:Domain of unknown function (DUF3854)